MGTFVLVQFIKEFGNTCNKTFIQHFFSTPVLYLSPLILLIGQEDLSISIPRSLHLTYIATNYYPTILLKYAAQNNVKSTYSLDWYRTVSILNPRFHPSSMNAAITFLKCLVHVFLNMNRIVGFSEQSNKTKDMQGTMISLFLSPWQVNLVAGCV